MQRGYAENVPLRRHHRWRSWRGPFRSVELNLVGWSALLLACCASAAVGMALLALAGAPTGWAAVAAVLPCVAARVWDRQQWRRLPMGIRWGGGLEEVEAVAAEVNRRGGRVHVQLERAWPGGVPLPGEQLPVLRLHGRDRRLVERVLVERGIRSPWRHRP